MKHIERATGIPYRSIQNWAAGLHEPDVSEALAIARALMLTVEQVFGDAPLPDTATAKRLRDALRAERAAEQAARSAGKHGTKQ